MLLARMQAHLRIFRTRERSQWLVTNSPPGRAHVSSLGLRATAGWPCTEAGEGGGGHWSVCLPSVPLEQANPRNSERGAEGAQTHSSSRLGNKRGGYPVSCHMALKETCLFLCLAFLPIHGGSLSIGAHGLHPHCFRGSHFTSHPPRAVEIGVLCGLWAGNGPLRLLWEGRR